LVLAAAAGQARHLPLKTTRLARGAYPQAAKPLSAANDVGRSPLLEQDTHARKRLFLDWQGADDTATRHDFYSTTPGKVQPPEHPLTFTSLCRQDHDQASRLRLQHSPPPSQGHAQERTSCADQPPLPAQPFSPACTTPGEPAFGSALRQGAGAGGDCQARLPDRNVHRSKVTCAGDIPRQATQPSAPAPSLFQSSFYLRPTVCVSGGGAGGDKTPRAGFRLGVEKARKCRRIPTVRCTLCWAALRKRHYAFNRNEVLH